MRQRCTGELGWQGFQWSWIQLWGWQEFKERVRKNNADVDEWRKFCNARPRIKAEIIHMLGGNLPSEKIADYLCDLIAREISTEKRRKAALEHAHDR